MPGSKEETSNSDRAALYNPAVVLTEEDRNSFNQVI